MKNTHNDRAVINKIKHVLRKLKIMKEQTFAEMIEEAFRDSIKNFGTPDTIFMSPNVLERIVEMSDDDVE